MAIGRGALDHRGVRGRSPRHHQEATPQDELRPRSVGDVLSVHVCGPSRLSRLSSEQRPHRPCRCEAGFEAFRQQGQFVGAGRVTDWARRASPAAAAGTRAIPWPIGVVLTDPQGVVASRARHEHSPISGVSVLPRFLDHADVLSPRRAFACQASRRRWDSG